MPADSNTPEPEATEPQASILLIEDDPSVRNSTEVLLTTLGYRVDAVETVAAGMALVSPGSHDLLIADWTLPDGNGADAICQAREACGQLRTILITGSIEKEQENAANADVVLAKPLDFEAFQAALQRLIGG